MPREFSITRRVQFAETDMAGVLHFANYYRMMEEVEHAFWRSHGLSVVFAHEGREISWPRVATSCEYFAPLRFEDELELVLTVDQVGKGSVTFVVEFRSRGTRMAVGRTKAACCAVSDGKFSPVPIPPFLRAKLTE